jgi:adhesin/invasin
MHIFLRLVGSRSRLPALLTALVAGLSLSNCGGGDDLCTGPFCVTPPSRPQATRLRAGEGDGQSGTAGRQLPSPLEAVVTDDDNRPIQDVVVTFTPGEGAGSLSASEVRSDVQGRVVVNWTLGAEPGPQKVQAAAVNRSGPLNGSPLTFTAQAVRPPPARIVIVQPPPVTAQNRIPFEPQPAIQVLDADDQPVQGVEVVASIASGGGRLNGTATLQSDAVGRVAYTNLAIGGAKGPRILRFSVAEPAVEASSGTIDVGAGSPSTMSGVPPLSYEGTVSSPVDPAPTVVVRDSDGNPVPGATVSFTVNRDASVSPETATTNELGVAQVSWTIGRTANVTYSLTARLEGSGLAPVVFTAMARSGAAGGLQIVTEPSSSAQSGVPFAVQPVIQVVDQVGNPAPQGNVRIEATVSSGPTGGLQNVSVTTDASGRATFSGLTLAGAVGNYTISFSASNLAGVNSNPISLLAGPPAQLALTTSPSANARSREPLVTQPVIQVQDASGNPVAQPGVQVVASITAGDGTLGGQATVTTGADGRATFGDLSIAGSPGEKTLTFTSPGLDGVSARVRLPSVATIVVQAAPPSSAVVGTVISGAPAWILKDVGGQPVPDAPVVLTASTGGLVVPASGTTGGDGVIQVQTWTLGTTAGEQYVDVAVPGTETANRVTVRTTAEAPAQLQKISGEPQSAPVNSELPEPLVVRVVDQYDNGVAQVTVQWRACDGSGNYDPVTDGDGFSSADQPTGPEPGESCTRATVAGLGEVVFTYTVTPAAPSQSRMRTAEGAVVKSRGLPPVAPRSQGGRRPSSR